ncbi:MAG: hypothetical protein DI538_16405, partial [Azospira oryzae]
MSEIPKEKLKALQLTIDKLEKSYGKGAVMKLSDERVTDDIQAISTGSLGLDLALGIGGIPRGRVIEIYGPESSGKTTLTMHCIAEAQKKGGLAAFIDAEHAFDKSYAEKLGIDTENLLISQPDNGEQALEIAETNRNDLNVQELTLELQQQKLSAAKAALLPKLSLIGQYQIQAQADDLKLNDYVWPRTSFLGLQVSIPILNGGQNKSRIGQARILAQQEQIRLKDLKEEVKTTLASIISKWKEATSQLEIQITTVQSAELNHQMTEDRFKNGLGSRLELTDAELALTQAKINYLQAIYNLRRLHTELQYALGL